MQIVLQYSKSIPEYQKDFKGLQFKRPEKCKCGCVKFHKWGKYERDVAEKNEDHKVPIKRICCVKCRTTYSFLPSFCVSKVCFSTDFIMFFLKVLILKTKHNLGEKKRQAYTFLRHFTKSENLWVVFLRAKGLDFLPINKKERRIKIFTALLKIYESKNFMTRFLRETGRHFMT